MNPEIIKLTNQKSNKQIKKNGWKPLPPKLKRIDLSYNADLTSLEGIGHMPCLESVNCCSCGLTRLDEDLTQLKALTTLNLRKNKIENLSDVTNTFRALESVTNIDLSRNEFAAKDEREGKGVYYLAMLDLSQGRLKMLDDREILEKDYKRYDSLRSEIQCEELVANLNVECADKTTKMSMLLENLASRHRLEEEVLREAVRGATIAENVKYAEYTTFVNKQLRELKIKEKMTFATVGDIKTHLEQMKEGAPVYVQQQSSSLTPAPEYGQPQQQQQQQRQQQQHQEEEDEEEASAKSFVTLPPENNI